MRLTQRLPMRALSSMVGHQVRLARRHPHAGEIGYGIAVERLGGAVGSALLVRLEGCPHGVKSCYVFWASDVSAVLS